jgi:hypothetical protein
VGPRYLRRHTREREPCSQNVSSDRDALPLDLASQTGTFRRPAYTLPHNLLLQTTGGFFVADIDRTAFLTALATLALLPSAARAADAKRSFRCTARLDRLRDKKTIHQVDVVVEDGKSVSFLDGTWNYNPMPRTPIGLYVTFTVKDGAKIHVKADAEYGAAGGDAAGSGTRVVVSDSKTQVDDDFDPGQPVAYPWTIQGEAHTLVITVQPAEPPSK